MSAIFATSDDAKGFFAPKHAEQVPTYISMYKYKDMYLSIIYVYICTHTHIYLHIYIYIHTILRCATWQPPTYPRVNPRLTRAFVPKHAEQVLTHIYMYR